MQVFKATTLALATRMSEDPSVVASAHLRIVHGPKDRDPEEPDVTDS
jgi:hypothetical protein